MANGAPAGGAEAQPDPPSRPAAAGEPRLASVPAVNPTAAASEGEFVNKLLGEFRILRRLGQGGMAEVYLAEQTSLKRNVAVKVLRRERLGDELYLKRFQTEAMAAAALNHSNIVQVFMVGEQAGIQYIAQEYVQGMNLHEFLSRKGPPEFGIAVHIMKQVAAALGAAHAAGIVHRDIKPENIMITRKGDVKVADFGLAQLTQAGERLNLTKDGVTMGTPLYMSPEQVNGSKIDHRSDLYSLGVTCYHMLSGSPPFRGPTALSVAVQHLKQEPEPLENLRSDLPPALCRIVQKMMAKNPDKRYADAQAIIKDLKRLTQDRGAAQIGAAGDDGDSPAIRERPIAGGFFRRMGIRIWRAPDWPVFRQAWVVLLLAIVSGAASAGVGWFTRTPDPRAAPIREESAVKKRETAALQYFYAITLKNDIAAWKAVGEFFPRDRVFKDYADQQLAMLYLSHQQWDEAKTIFDGFAARGESEPDWKAFGLAGQAAYLGHNRDWGQSQKTIDRLKPHYGRLDPKMQRLVAETMKHNLKELGTGFDQDWKALLKGQDQDDN